MKEGYEKYCRNGLCEGESRPKKYYLDEHCHEELKDKCWYSGCQCPGERLIAPKEQQKQHLINIMKQDEELGLYDETFEDYLQRLKDRRTEDSYKYTDEDFIQYEEYIRDCCKSGMSVYKCLEFMYFAEKEIKLEDVFNDEKKEIVIKVIQEHKQETVEEYFLDNIKNVLLFKNDAQAIRFMEKYYHAKKEEEQHDTLPGFIKQFDPKEGEIDEGAWTVSRFLKWLELNKFKIVK